MRPETHSFTQEHSGQTHLAQMLRPPEKPVNWVVILGGILFLAGLFAVWVVSTSVAQSLLGSWLGAILGYLFVGTVFAYTFPPLHAASVRQRTQFRARVMAWEKTMRRWEKLAYCSRCDSVFDPDSGKTASPRNMRSLL